MDSRASPTSVSLSPKPIPLTIDTTNHTAMVSSRSFFHSPSSSCAFRPSPLNPSFTPSPTEEPTYFHRRSPTFPASRPLRPFPSIAQSLVSPKTAVPGTDVHLRNDTGSTPAKPEEDGLAAGGKKSRKTIEISSKWKGGFFVLGLTQAEFSRRD